MVLRLAYSLIVFVKAGFFDVLFIIGFVLLRLSQSACFQFKILFIYILHTWLLFKGDLEVQLGKICFQSIPFIQVSGVLVAYLHYIALSYLLSMAQINNLCISLKIIELKKVWDSIIIGLNCILIGLMGFVSIAILIMSLDAKCTFEKGKSLIGLSVPPKDCFATCSILPRHKI